VRYEAVHLLELIGDARAVEPLIAVLKKSGYGLVSDIAKTLGKIGDARAVEPLIAFLNASDKYARREAAEALGKIGDVKAIEPLVMLFRKGNSQVGYCDVSLGYDVLPPLEKLGWNPTTEQDKEAVRQVEIYRMQLRHRASREMAEESTSKAQTRSGSRYWICPKCGTSVERIDFTHSVFFIICKGCLGRFDVYFTD